MPMLRLSSTSLTWSTMLLIVLPSLASAHGAYHNLMDELAAELKAKPSEASLYVRRAALEVEHSEWQSALIDLEIAVRCGADELELALLRGRSLAVGKRWEPAKAEFDRFIQAHPKVALAYVERARVKWQIPQLADALHDYRTALKLMPRPESDIIIEVTDALTAQSLHDEALQVVTQGIANVGDVPQLVLKAMELEIAAKRFDDALARVDTMAKMMPRAEPWMARRASVLAQAGRIEDSRAAWLRLREHILALPNLERGSHAMSTLLEQANQALAVLTQVSTTPLQISPVNTSKP